MRLWRAITGLMLLGIAQTCVAATYYIDAVRGDDSRSGTSTEVAWASLKNLSGHQFQPGDAILLRRGQSWTGSVTLTSSGTAEAPIVLGAYGGGDRPLIKGNGAAETIRLEDVSFWTVRDLTVTNEGKLPEPRNGILVHVTFKGVATGIRLENLDIRDVNGDVTSRNSGGIGFLAWRKNGHAARFDGVTIERCTIELVHGQGIWFETRGGSQTTDEASANTNIRISTTALIQIGGAAIMLRNAEDARIEHNTIRYAGYEVPANAVIVAQSQGTVIRENEVSNTGAHKGTAQNSAFEAGDGSSGTVIEYNWSHDNAGGMADIVNDPALGQTNSGTVVRYNLSENDGDRVIGLGGAVKDSYVYNNTMFIGRGHAPLILDAGRLEANKPGDPDGMAFANNVIYSEGGGGYVLSARRVAIDSNCYFGKASVVSKLDAHAETGDPGFDRKGLPVKGWDQIGRYRVAAGTGCAKAGWQIAFAGGRDILGTAISVAGRGAVAGK